MPVPLAQKIWSADVVVIIVLISRPFAHIIMASSGESKNRIAFESAFISYYLLGSHPLYLWSGPDPPPPSTSHIEWNSYYNRENVIRNNYIFCFVG